MAYFVECESGGKHKLKKIYEVETGPGLSEVVRWCSDCGAIVVDNDFDGRTNPGVVMSMKRPLIVLIATQAEAVRQLEKQREEFSQKHR